MLENNPTQEMIDPLVRLRMIDQQREAELLGPTQTPISAENVATPTNEAFIQNLRDTGQNQLADDLTPPPQPATEMPLYDGVMNTLGDTITSALGGVTSAVEDLGEIATNVGDFLIDKNPIINGPFEYLTGHKMDFFDDNPNYAGMLTPDALKPKTKLGLLAQSMVNFGARIWAMNLVGAGLANEFPEALAIVTRTSPKLPNLLDATLTDVPLATRATTGLVGNPELFPQGTKLLTQVAETGPIAMTSNSVPQSVMQQIFSKTGEGVITGALGDFTKHPKETLIDPDDPLINQPWYKNTLASVFNSDPDDPQSLKRAKNMLAWVVPNTVTSFVMSGLSTWNQLRKAKSEAQKREIRKQLFTDTENLKKAQHATPEVDQEQITKDTIKSFKDKVDKGYKINRGELTKPNTRLNPNDLATPASKTVKPLDWAVRFRENAMRGEYGDEKIVQLADDQLQTVVDGLYKTEPKIRTLIRELGVEGRQAGLKLTESERNLATVIHTKLTPDLIDAVNRFSDLKAVPDIDPETLGNAYSNLLDHITAMVEGQEELVSVGGWAGRALRQMGKLSKFSNRVDLKGFELEVPDHDTLRQTIMKNFPMDTIEDLGKAFAGAVDTYNDGRAVTWLANQVKSVIQGAPPMTLSEMFLDMERSWSYFSMLSGPRTHVANFLGNTIKVFGTDPMDVYFSRLNPTLNPFTIGDGNHWNFDDAREAVSAYFGGLRKGFGVGVKVARAAWKYQTSVLAPEEGMKFHINPLLGGPDGNLLKRIMDIPGNLLNVGDEVFKQAAYAGQVELQVQDFLKTAEGRAILGSDATKETLEQFKEALVDKFYGNLFIDKANKIVGATANTGFKDATGILNADKALEGALVSTWNNTPTGNLLFNIMKVVPAIPGGHHLLPFTKTVFNIGKDALVDHNPLGIVRLLMKTAREDPEIHAKVVGQFCTSLILWGSAYGLYKSGNITGGGPSNPTARKLWLEEGHVPYSIRFPGLGWIGVGNLDPVAAPIIMVADMFDKAEEIDPSTGQENGYVAAGFNALTDYATNRTWLKSIGDFFKVVEAQDKTKGQAAWRYIRQNLSGAYIPSFLATTRQMIDPYSREARDVDAPFTNRLPIWDDEVTPPKVSWLTGELVGTSYGDSWYGRALSAPFFMRKYDRDKPDVVFETMVKSNVNREPSHKLNCGITLNDSDYAKYCKLVGTTKIYGKTLYQTLEKQFNSPYWYKLYGIDPNDKSLSKKKEQWITKQVNKYKKQAEKEFLKQNPNADQWRKLNQKAEADYKAGRTQNIPEELISYDSDKDYSNISNVFK